MSRVALLDVNLLVALFDPAHVHHEVAHDWFADQRSAGWATCPVTENGLVRVVSHPNYGADHRPAEIIAALRKFRASGHHTLWPDDVSLADKAVFRSDTLTASRQVTDVYLLGLARAHRGTLATLDRSIPWQAVAGASRADLQVVES